MKNRFTLALALCFISFSAWAQFASHVTLQHTYTKAQVDSILSAQGLPSGFITTQYGVKVYKVIYNTVDADSLPTTASGLMVVPVQTACEVPILSYQHNNVFQKNDVPSRYRNEWFIGLAAGSIGLITVMPDGLGLGSSPGFHPFLHLQSEATSVIDMIRAAREVVDTTGTSFNSQLFLAGIAEGGYASLAAHQYIQQYLGPDIQVTGTGVITGYSDLSGTLQNTILSPNTYTDQSFLPATFITYNNIYHYAANDSDIFVYPYDTLLPHLYNGNYETYQINQQMPAVPNQVLQQSIIDTLQNDPTNFFTQLLRKNDPFNWTPHSKVDFLFCTADEVIPYQHAAVAYSHFIANGSVTVDTLNVGATYTHNLCRQFSTLVAIQVVRQLIFQPLQGYTSATAVTSAISSDGSVATHDTLGNAPYTWHWSTGDSTATVSGLAPGTYYVTVTDQSHCTLTDSAVVSFATGINDLSMADIKVYPNPTQGQLVIDWRNINEKVELMELLDINGNVIETPMLRNTAITTIDLSPEAKGVYILHIRAQSGKELRRKIILL